MAAKRKVSQEDLRKLMGDMKSNTGKSSIGGKKLKLTSKELALLEEEKRQKSIRDQEKIRLKQEKMARIVPNQGLQPKKSILKNSSVVSTNYRYNHHAQTSSQNQIQIREPEVKPSKVKVASVTKFSEENVTEEESGALPEGFFDDPKLDAKARNVQYVDHNEEEWEKFQKEIGDEVATAQEILVEDRNEATADRQLEDIDEQIEAWKRVAQLEEKKETMVKSRIIGNKEAEEDSDSDSDVELDDLTDWRKKS